jgi:hypothetical protein
LRRLFDDIFLLGVVLRQILVDPHFRDSGIVHADCVDVCMEEAELLVEQGKHFDYLFQNQKGFWLTDRGQLAKPGYMLSEHLLLLS